MQLLSVNINMFFFFIFYQIWSVVDDTPKQEVVVEEPVERKINYSNVVVTELLDDLRFYVQYVDNGKSPSDSC